MQNELKWYLEQYQINMASGLHSIADNLLNELFNIRYTKNKGNQFAKFTHPDINSIFYRTYEGKIKDKAHSFKILDHSEFMSVFLKVVWQNIKKAAKPFEYSNGQIKSWLTVNCVGDLRKELKKNYDFTTVAQNPENEIEMSMQEYNRLSNDSSYIQFLNEKHGLHRILGKQDAEIIDMCFHKNYIGMNQIDIAEKLNIDPKLVSKRFKKAVKKLEIEYRTWKQIAALKGSDTYFTIYNFLKFYDRTIDSDTEDSNFDHYNFFISFLKDEYKKGEQHISSKSLFQNKKLTTYSVFDVLTDKLRDKKIWTLLYDLLDNGKSALTPSQKDKAVILGVKTFREFIASSDKTVHNASKAAYEWDSEHKRLQMEQNKLINDTKVKKYNEFVQVSDVLTYKI